jgi:hypothetical protein
MRFGLLDKDLVYVKPEESPRGTTPLIVGPDDDFTVMGPSGSSRARSRVTRFPWLRA